LIGLPIVSSSSKVKEANEQFGQFIAATISDGVPVEKVIEVGSLRCATQDVLLRIKPNVVVICKHGIKGMQHIFGARILKLVQAIPLPCIVPQENCTIYLAHTQKNIICIGSASLIHDNEG
jgi:hypothetical protein